jgi:SAM-dependent methyltransferase
MMAGSRLAAPGWGTTGEHEMESSAWAPFGSAAMTLFRSVDTEADPARALRYLERAADAESGMKHYAMAVHARRRPHGPILDLGCGAGHDLALLNSVGLPVVGVDPSAFLLRAATARTNRPGISLVQGAGEQLPFRDGAFGGCRLERVLIHVADPLSVVSEAVRCMRRGGLITVFEPDWSEFRVRTHEGAESAGWLAGLRHPGVGGALWGLLEDAGCDVVDRVEELSVWRSIEVLDAVIGLRDSLRGAVDADRIGDREAATWLREQTDREANGTFYATIPKVLVVAVKA